MAERYHVIFLFMNGNFQKICCIIPVYQAERTILDVMLLVRKNQPQMPMIVVDDGSTDGSAAILTTVSDIVVIRHPRNHGKGAALKSGILRAKQMGFTHAITIDADLQHPPALITAFISRQRQTSADLIMGERNFAISVMPLPRILSNMITSLMISIRIGRRIRDSQCGFRLLKIDTLEIEKYSEDGFQFESEFLLRIPRSGFRIAGIKIPTIYQEEGSSIRNIADTVKFIFLFLKSYIWT